MATNVRRSVSMRNTIADGRRKTIGSSFAVNGKSSTISKANPIGRHSVAFPLALETLAVRKIEAADVVDILRKNIAFVAGGFDCHENLIISMVASCENAELTFDEVTSTLIYLSTIPRNSERHKYPMTVIIDGRLMTWSRIRLLLRATQHTLGRQVQYVLVVKAETASLDKDISSADIKREKAFMDFQLLFVSISKLQKYVDLDQLTSDFNGTLSYNHTCWIETRLAYEKFAKEANAAICHLDTIQLRLYGSTSFVTTENDFQKRLQQYGNLYDSIKEKPTEVLVAGDALLDVIESDGDSGFKRDLQCKQNSDLFYARGQVIKLLDSVKLKQNQIRDLCNEARRKLIDKLELQKLQKNVKGVVDWVLVFGEDLLSSEKHIGKSFLEADNYRKYHEHLELQCTEAYGAYAEARHMAIRLVKSNHSSSQEINSQREYMDAVCRNFARRLEKRRNLLVSSVRFHRTADQLFHCLCELAEYLQPECTLHESHRVEAAIQRLDETFSLIVALKDQVVSDGDRLLNMLTVTVPNALMGNEDVAISEDIVHVKTILAQVMANVCRCEEMVDVRRLRLKQILHVSICERDAQQAISWILELCTVLVNGHILVGCNLHETEELLKEHREFEKTAKNTYEYGRQLLHTALSLRKPCGYSEEPNAEIGQRLFHAWKTFLTGSAERTMRLKVCATFHRNSAEILKRLDDCVFQVSSELKHCSPTQSVLTVRRYLPVKQKLELEVQEAKQIGQILVERFRFPVIPDYRSGKQLADELAIQQMEDLIRSMTDKVRELSVRMTNPRSPRHSIASATSTSNIDDWKSFSSSSMPEDWKTCPSTLTSADADEYLSAQEFLSNKSISRRCSAAESLPVDTKEQEAAKYSLNYNSLPMLNSHKSPRQIALNNGSLWQETVSSSASTNATIISKTIYPAGTTSIMTTLLQKKCDEEWRNCPESFSHTLDETSSFCEKMHRQSTSTKINELPSWRTNSKSETKSNVNVLSRMPHINLQLDKVFKNKQHGLMSNGTSNVSMERSASASASEDEDNDIFVKYIHKSKEWLQLKILDMQPDLSRVGSTLEEALEYQRQHAEVLIKLQGKQSPVEELLNQADQLISTQKPKAEVYAAMAESLGLAWRDLNNQLEHRKQLLEQSVIFHRRAKEFFDKLDQCERECRDIVLPTDVDMLRMILQRHNDSKKGILETLMYSLNVGQLLLEMLREVATFGTADARPDYLCQSANSAIFQVEQLMESLHDRRRRFEILWTKHKQTIEDYLQLCLLYSNTCQTSSTKRLGGTARVEPVIYGCIVQGEPTPNVQWLRDGRTVLNGVQETHQYNFCQLTIPSAEYNDEGNFICVATNPAGSANTSATLRIKNQGMVIQSPTSAKPSGSSPPTFEKVPQNSRFVLGGNAVFELKVKGIPKPQVLWTRKGTPVVNSPKYNVHYDDSTGMSTLQIKNLQRDDEGEYTCNATNQYGKAVCNVLIQSGMIQSPSTARHVVHDTNVHTTRTIDRKVAGTVLGAPSSDTTTRVTHRIDYDVSDNGGPLYYTNGTEETFKVDTFEYRLLREIDFRQSKTRRLPGEADTDTDIDNVTAGSSGPTRPPQLLQRLRNSKLLEGSDATFQTKISGNPKPKITWFRNGQRIVSSSRYHITFKDQLATLHIHMAFANDAGHYTLLAENSVGRVATSAQLVIEAVGTHDDLHYTRPDKFEKYDGTLSQHKVPVYVPTSEPMESEPVVSKSLRPSFVHAPADKEVTEGKMVRFDCRVSGRPFPDVSWFLNGRQILDDQSHKLIVNEAGNHSLLITVAKRTDGGVYTCVAKNKGGECSFRVNLTVIEKEQVVAPKFVERFQTIHVRQGEPVSLTCRAIGTPLPHITWQKDGVEIHSTPACVIETNGGSSALHIRQTTSFDSAWYQCTAQNTAGSTSTRARLYVVIEQAPIPEPWRLVLPKPTKVIMPEGSPEREIIWLRHVERAQHYQSHPEEEPRITTKPMFTHPLKNLSDITEGDRAHFEARLIPIGDPSMQIEWYLNGRSLPASSRFMTSYRFGYVSLTILNVYSQDQGTYACRAVNELGDDVTTCSLTITVRQRIEYGPQHPESLDKIQQLEGWDRYKRTISVEETPQKPEFLQPLRSVTELQESQYAHLEAKVVPLSDPNMKIEWYFNNKQLTAGSRITTIYSFGYVALNIMHLRTEDSGTYTCRAINRAGEAVSTGKLKVTVRASGVITDTGVDEQKRYIEKTDELESYQRNARRDFIEEPLVKSKPQFRTHFNDQKIIEGQNAYFEAKLDPVGDPNLRVDWYLNGKPLEASSRTTTFFNFGYVALTIKSVQENDIGTYVCQASNKLGRDTTSAKLTCLTKGTILLESQHPEGLEKIRHLEDTSRYTRQETEETTTRQLPRFTVPLQGNNKLVEGQAAHFEARLEPVNDSTMKVEWFLNGEPLQSGHRYKTYFDFGYVALDILYVFPEDSGMYTVRATNSVGVATESSELYIKPKSAIDTSAIHKVGLEKIQRLEDSHFREPQYSIDEISKSKPIFVVPLNDHPPVKEGDHIHLEGRLEPIGDQTMRVEWFFNGRPLTIGSRFKPIYDFGYVALDVSSALPDDTGEYTCRAVNHLGTSHTSSCVTVIERKSINYDTQHPAGLQRIQALEDTSRFQRPKEEEQPAARMPSFVKSLHNIDTVEGANVHLEARLQPVNDPNMKVDWFVNGKPVATGHRYRPAHDFDYVALDILSAYPEDCGVYTCRAVNSVGEAVTSSSVKILAKKAIILESQHPEGLEKIQYLEDTSRFQRDMWTEDVVKVHPRFLTKFKNLDNLREGQNAHFECRLEPITDPNLKVEWFKNNKSLTVGHRFRPIHDFGYVALDILGVVEEDSGVYTCRATNIVGSETNTVRLNVKGGKEIITDSQHPEGLQQIQHLEDSSRYQREEITEEVSTQAPVFTTSIQNVDIKEGQRAHFECRLIPVSDPNLKVEWLHNGRPVKSGSRFVETNNFGFVALDILTAYPEDNGTYSCRASNPLGTAVTTANLKCSPKRSIYLETQHEGALEQIQALEDTSRYYRPKHQDEITTQAPVFTQAIKDLRLVENQSAHFECRLIPVGDPKLKVEWFHNGISLQSASRVVTTNDFGYVALDLKYVRPDDSGTYTCKATNELGTAVTSATLVVQAKGSLLLDTQHPEGLERIRQLEDTSRLQRHEYEELEIRMPPKFVTPLTGPTELNENQSSHYECRIEPHIDPNLKVEWFFNGRPMGVRHRFMTMFDFGYAALDILHVYPEDSGEYTIKATNKVGTATSTINIRVKGKSGVIRDTHNPEGLQKIAELEDGSRHIQPAYEEAPIREKPQFQKPLRNLDRILEGQSAHLECIVTPSNDPNMKVEWFFNGRPVPTSHRFRTTYDFGYISLDILYAYPEDSGTFMCKATNNNGEAITTCHVNIEPTRQILTETCNEEGLRKIQEMESMCALQKEEEPVFETTRPEFIVPLTSVPSLVEGDHLHLEARLIPVNDPKLKVEWFINGVEIRPAHRFRMTHDFGYVSMDVLYAYPEDSGTIMCQATNDKGEAVTSCSVQIQSRRSIYYGTHHPEGLEKIMLLEATPKEGPIEVEERPTSKPLILSPLMGTTDLMEGQQCHLECRVEPIHDPKMTIEFTHNGKVLDNASRFRVTFDFGYVALDFRHVIPEDAGEYKVTAKNELGQASSSIVIRVQAKGSIISDSLHPDSLEKIREFEDDSRYVRPEFVEPRTAQRPVFTVPLMNLDNLKENEAAHLECRLIPVGDPTLKVEWFYNERPLTKSSRFATTHDFSYVALDIQYVRPDDVGVYMCRATNELGEAVTTASIKVQSKASIIYDTNNPEGLEKIRQLEDDRAYVPPEAPEKVYGKPVFVANLTGPAEVIEGRPAHFECRVVPVGDPNLKFEWYINGIELNKGMRLRPNHDFGVVTLDIDSVIPEDAGIYMCKAMNLSGEAVTSTSMRVIALRGVYTGTYHKDALDKTRQFEYDDSRIPEDWTEPMKAQPPRFIVHLTGKEKYIEGQTIHMDGQIEPINDEKLVVEWYRNGVKLYDATKMRAIVDFGLVSLDISGSIPEDSGIYTCRVYNEVGEAISTCNVKVEGSHWLIGHPQHPESLDKIRELEEPKYKEQLDMEPVYGSPVFITHLNNVDCHEGDCAHFECRVEPAKDPSMKVEFFLNGKPLPLATRFTSTFDFGYIALDVSHVFPDDAGIYTCRASNLTGQAVTTGSMKVHSKGDIYYETQHPKGQAGLEKVLEADGAYLAKYQRDDVEAELYYPKPTFVVPLEAGFTVNESKGLQLQCRVEPSTDPKMTIDWFFNGKPLDMATRFKLIHEFGHVVLDISDLWPRDSGIYTCRARNDAGEAFTTTTIRVIGKGTIYEETLHPKGEVGLEQIQNLEDSLHHVEGIIQDEDGHPPVFTSQFENLTNLSQGDIAHFEASLTPAGDQTMVVEWFFNNQLLKASHRIRTVHAFGMVVLEILGVYVEDSGEYTCRATNKWGRAEITVHLQCVERTRGQKPHFTTHIQSLNELNEGDSAHFQCNLIPVGDPAMTVEWYHNGTPLRHSSRIKTLSDFGFVVMDIAFVQPEDSGEYICRASNKYGEDLTRATIQCKGRGTLFLDSLRPQSLNQIAALEGARYTTQTSVESTSGKPPRFEKHISNLELLIESQSAHFEARLTPIDDPNLTVEWYFNGEKLKYGHRFRTFHDFGLVILDILYCYEEDSGVYEARAINKFGKDVSRATLQCKAKKSLVFDSQVPVQELAGVPTTKPQAPMFTVPLENVTDLREGENAHIEARLIPTDDQNLVVEWFRNGKTIAIGSRIRTIHDFGFVVLEISPMYPEDTGEYSCRAKNDYGEAVTTCKLKCEGKRGVILESQLPKGMEAGVDKIAQLESYSDKFIAESWTDKEEGQPPQFVTQPQDLSLMENSLAHFECRVVPVGDPTLKVEWLHNGRPVCAGSRVKTIHDFGFVILEVAGVYQRDAGVYTCKASNKYGEASVAVNLSVKGRLGVIMEPQLPSDFKTGTESIKRLEDSMNRHDEPLEAEEAARPPIFITQIQDLPHLNEGEPAHFECRVEPVGDSTMKIEWFQNGRPLDTGSRVHTNEDFGFIVLDFDWTFPRDSGEYICRASNMWGSTITKANLVCKGKRDVIIESQLPQGMNADKFRDIECPPQYVAPAEDTPLQPPKFITQIQPLEQLLEGDGAHFECRLHPVNDPKLRVEWYHNGKPLMSGHRFKTTHDFDYVALDILYVYAEDSGEYSAHAQNDLGQDTTKAFLKCKGGQSIILYNQLPRELKKSEAVIQMEATLRKYTQDIQLTEDDIFDPDKKQPPRFITQIKSCTDLKEFESTKFECQLSPVGDPHMKVEWFFNGRPLAHKNRFNPIYDFGYVALDFGWVYPEDSGEYICRATNMYGTDETRAVLKSVGKPSVDYESQLPREISSSTIRRIREIEEAWIKAPDDDDEGRKQRQPPFFVIKLEPAIVTEGEWAKFFCRVTGYPRARVMWLINGHAVTTGSRYKLSFDGMHHLDIPKSRQYDAGKIEVIARNSLGEAHCSTSLVVKPKHDDYRAVLKNSPRPWYDTDLKRYQQDRVDIELERKFEDHVTKKASKLFHTEDDKEGHIHKVTPLDKTEDFSELAETFRKRRMESEAYYKTKDGSGPPPGQDHVTIVQDMAKTYETQIDSQTICEEPDPLESSVHGKEIHTQKQTQTQKEKKGDLEITRKKTVTETVEQEHKGVTKERVVKGRLPETKAPAFIKKLQPCRAFEKQSARFECEFTGVPPPTVTWYRETFPIQNSEDLQITSTDTKSVLLIKEVFMEDSGVFAVVAENRGGTAKSTTNLVVEERKEKRKGGVVPPSFNVTIQDIKVKNGQLARLDAKVTGSKPMDVYWLKNNQKILPDIRYKILEEDDVYTLLIIETFPEDSGIYHCVAINQGGEARCEAQIQVDVPAPPTQAKPKPAAHESKDLKAPSIVEPLKDQTVTEGEVAVFKCKVAANPIASVKWLRGNSIVKQSRYFRMSQDGDVYTLTISEAFPEDEGTYKCVLCNSAGALTLSAHLTVLVPESATVPPTVAPMENVTVKEGQPARFVTEISGTPTPTVQWSREGVLIPQSTDFQMSQEGTACSLLIANTYVEDSGRYTCRATNPSGQAEASAFLRVENDDTHVTSTSAAVRHPEDRKSTDSKEPAKQIPSMTVPEEDKKETADHQPLTFVRELSAVTAEDGHRAILECQLKIAPEDSTPLITWYFNGVPIPPSNDFKISQGKNGLLRLDIVEVFPEDEGLYSCTAVNRAGRITTAAKLTVLTKLPSPGTPPQFTKKLRPQLAKDGENVYLECIVEGDPLPKIKWFRNDEILQDNTRDFQMKFNETTGTSLLIINNVTSARDHGSIYTCVASNVNGESETKSELTVDDESNVGGLPRFTKTLDDLTVPIGKSVEMLIDVDANPPSKILWYYEGKRLKSTNELQITMDGSKSRLFIKEVFVEDEGKYEVKASNKFGKVICDGFLRVIGGETKKQVEKISPEFIKTLMPQTVPAGEATVMEVTVDANPEATFKWYHDSELIDIMAATALQTNIQIKSGSNVSTLIIDETMHSNAGTYTCSAENVAGYAKTSAILTVDVGVDEITEPPQFTFQIISHRVMDGDEVRFTCQVSGKPIPQVTWFHDGKEVIENKDVRINMTDQGHCELYMTEVFPEDAGHYECKAFNCCGTTVTQAELVVEAYEYIPDSEIASISVTTTDNPGTTQSAVETDTVGSGSEDDMLEEIPLEDPGTPRILHEERGGIAPKFSRKLEATEIAKVGDSVSFQCCVIGQPTPTIRWYRHGLKLNPNQDFIINFDKSSGQACLTLAEVYPDDIGEYACRAKNCHGVDSTVTVLSTSD